MAANINLKSENINISEILESPHGLDAIVQKQDLKFEHIVRQQDCVQNLTVIKQVFQNILKVANHCIDALAQKDQEIERLQSKLI